MKIEVGKKYLTRDGREAEVMTKGEGPYPFYVSMPCIGGSGRQAVTMTEDGEYIKGNKSLCDLVSEIQPAEYPAGTEAEAAEPVSTDYADLSRVYGAAFNQAAASDGKGVERHANGKAFNDQPIMSIPAMLGGIDGQIYQVMKKAQEANTMSKRGNQGAAIRELYGVMNYAAAAILFAEKLNDAA